MRPSEPPPEIGFADARRFRPPLKGEVKAEAIAASSRLTIRPATREDVEAFYEEAAAPTVKAWVGEIEGRIAGIGGLAFSQGRWVAFLDLADEARRYKVSIVKAARRAMREAGRAGHCAVFAGADAREPMARRFLTSLGFERDTNTGIFRWQA